MDICYHLPSFTDHYSLNILIADYIKQKPEYFRDNIKIASVFGSFPGTMWNGGRNVHGPYNPKMDAKILEAFNSRGIPLRFTFTNPVLTEAHIKDDFGNEMLKMADNGMNEVIVMSPILEQHIRENFPNYKITSSTCKQIRDMNDLNAELDKDYNLVVIDYNWNNKFDQLEQIKDKARCEVLLNACCRPNCPRRGEHYASIGKTQIDICKAARSPIALNNVVIEEFNCDYTNNDIYDLSKYTTYISPESIEKDYIPMGFNQFKLEGRTIGDVKMLEMYVHYLAKPEFRDKARLELLTALTGRIKFFNVLPQ